jgi:predicted DsbA family dithiol-disulfide isomerase
MMATVRIVHFSDMLCIWALVGQGHLQRLVQEFGAQVEVEVHFCSVFPDTQTKITKAWGARGGFAGYGAHVKSVADRFEGIALHPDVWTRVQPCSSASPHLFVKALELLEEPGLVFGERPSVQAAVALRRAFFERAEDIANWNVQRSIAEAIGVDFADVLQRIETGEAIARLSADYDLAQGMGVQGSPTYILNEGRQKLFGDVGYGILAANVTELLAHARGIEASLCA